MNAMAKTNTQQAAPIRTPLTKSEVFMASAITKDRKAALERVLPDHVKKDRFFRNFAIAINQHPKLLNCDPAEVFNEVSKAASLGLYMDPQLGEAYLITGYSQGRDVPQLRLGYRGLIKLARQSGEIKTIYAHEVHAMDEVEILLGDEKRIYHKPNLAVEDRGPVVLYYAVVKYANGETDFEPMTIGQIHTIRDKSDGWKAFKNGKIKSTPWSTDEGEMAKKTVLRRLLKRVPQSPDLEDAINHDQRHEVGAGVIDTQPVAPALPQTPAEALRIEAAAPAPQPTIREMDEDNDTPAEPEPSNEITDADIEAVQAKARDAFGDDGELFPPQQ